RARYTGGGRLDPLVVPGPDERVSHARRIEPQGAQSAGVASLAGGSAPGVAAPGELPRHPQLLAQPHDPRLRQPEERRPDADAVTLDSLSGTEARSSLEG